VTKAITAKAKPKIRRLTRPLDIFMPLKLLSASFQGHQGRPTPTPFAFFFVIGQKAILERIELVHLKP
jgi:hypothetical protein